MSKNLDRGPKPAQLLFKNLFEDCCTKESFEAIAAGVSACWRNSERLLSDATCLIQSSRLSSARFLVTTAREELAKSYILVDACRLDFGKHKSVLRKLCRAFYDHICKHAYLEVLEVNGKFVDSMEQAKGLWEIAAKPWWPSRGLEYGEPDMPHSTCFDRQLPLYVDYSDYDRFWCIPSDAEQYRIPSVYEQTSKLVETWRSAESEGLCGPEVFEAMNTIFRNQYLKEDSTTKQLQRLFRNAAVRVEDATSISAEIFLESPLIQWPLYDFVLR